MSTMNKVANVAARVAVALLFLFSGIGKIRDPKMTEGFMTGHGMPIVPFFLVASILVEVGGAIWLISGWKARWAALLLMLFLIPTTLIFHNFWAAAPKEYTMQVGNFLKNLALMGGLALYALNAQAPSGK